MMIQLDGVRKSFGGRPAVIDLSLAVPQGAIYGLLGHNGAGKSTTLGVLLGQVFPDAGTVRIHGCDVFGDRRGALAEVGAIFESPCFYDYLTGMRNLRIFCDYTARTSARRIADVVELVGLTERIGHKVGTYSHGMRQRLALAQALLPGPRTLILDEPTDGLDPQGIAEFRAVIRRLNRELGLTILFSSHLLSEVEQLCGRVAVMHRGTKVFDGDWSASSNTGRLFELDVEPRDAALRVLRDALLIEDDVDATERLTLTPGAGTVAVNRLLHERGFAVSKIAPVKLSLEDFYMTTIAPGTAPGISGISGAPVSPPGGVPC